MMNQKGRINVKKVIGFNISLVLLVMCIKVWNFINLRNLMEYYSESGIKVWMNYDNFFNLYLYKSSDARMLIRDCSIYVLLIGLIANILFLYKSVQKRK
jgi:hypothetical protein